MRKTLFGFSVPLAIVALTYEVPIYLNIDPDTNKIEFYCYDNLSKKQILNSKIILMTRKSSKNNVYPNINYKLYYFFNLLKTRYIQINDINININNSQLIITDEINEKQYKYNIDSIYIEGNSKKKNKPHGISGITCNNEKYLYNGYREKSKSYVCKLRKIDWTNDFCVKINNCPYVNKNYKLIELYENKVLETMCFEKNNYQNMIVCVKDDIPDITRELNDNKILSEYINDNIEDIQLPLRLNEIYLNNSYKKYQIDNNYNVKFSEKYFKNVFLMNVTNKHFNIKLTPEILNIVKSKKDTNEKLLELFTKIDLKEINKNFKTNILIFGINHKINITKTNVNYSKLNDNYILDMLKIREIILIHNPSKLYEHNKLNRNMNYTIKYNNKYAVKKYVKDFIITIVNILKLDNMKKYYELTIYQNIINKIYFDFFEEKIEFNDKRILDIICNKSADINKKIFNLLTVKLDTNNKLVEKIELMKFGMKMIKNKKLFEKTKNPIPIYNINDISNEKCELKKYTIFDLYNFKFYPVKYNIKFINKELLDEYIIIYKFILTLNNSLNIITDGKFCVSNSFNDEFESAKNNMAETYTKTTRDIINNLKKIMEVL